MACVRKVKDGRWRLDYRDKGGKRYRKFFDQKGAANDACTDLKKAMKDGVFIAPQKIPTFAEVAARWLESKATKHPSTIDYYRGHVDNHLLAAFGDQRLDRIGLEAIERFVASCSTGNSRRRRSTSYLAASGRFSARR